MEFKLIVGLGNPGAEYERTYHNVGTLFVDHLAAAGGDKKAPKHARSFSYSKTEGAVLVKPDVFMNESGPAVKAALEYFSLSPAAMLIAHDDSDIVLGEFKYSFDRGSAGHKGVESVMKALDGQSFWRLRIGIRPDVEGAERKKAGDFVLSPIGAAAMDKLQGVFATAAKSMTKLMVNEAPLGPETI